MCGMKKFSIIDHTADVGVAACGGTREELFANAALGMFSIVGDPARVVPRQKRSIHAAAANIESLLAAFLTELLYLFEIEHFMPCDLSVESVSDSDVRATVRGEPISYKHEIYTEIKAVTHHELKVQQSDSGWTATVIFDV